MPSADAKEKNKITATINDLDNEIAQISDKSAGDLYGSLETLVVSNRCAGGNCLSWKNDLYPLLYTNFNQAIHPDLLVLSKLVRQNGNKRIYLADYDAMDINELKIYCMNCVFNIIAATRAVYEWDYKDIKEEYLDIKKDFKRE